jgi:hypothetical protein
MIVVLCFDTNLKEIIGEYKEKISKIFLCFEKQKVMNSKIKIFEEKNYLEANNFSNANISSLKRAASAKLNSLAATSMAFRVLVIAF